MKMKLSIAGVGLCFLSSFAMAQAQLEDRPCNKTGYPGAIGTLVRVPPLVHDPDLPPRPGRCLQFYAPDTNASNYNEAQIKCSNASRAGEETIPWSIMRIENLTYVPYQIMILDTMFYIIGGQGVTRHNGGYTFTPNIPNSARTICDRELSNSMQTENGKNTHKYQTTKSKNSHNELETKNSH